MNRRAGFDTVYNPGEKIFYLLLINLNLKSKNNSPKLF